MGQLAPARHAPFGFDVRVPEHHRSTFAAVETSQNDVSIPRHQPIAVNRKLKALLILPHGTDRVIPATHRLNALSQFVQKVGPRHRVNTVHQIVAKTIAHA